MKSQTLVAEQQLIWKVGSGRERYFVRPGNVVMAGDGFMVGVVIILFLFFSRGYLKFS